MMKSLLRLLLICTLLLGVRVAPAFPAEEWVQLDENKESSFSYDKSSVTRSKDDIVTVTTRVVYTEKGREAAIGILEATGPLTKLTETRYTHDIDCGENESRLLKVVHLDKAGTALKTTDLSRVTHWDEIPAGSRIDKVQEIICNE
jgi:hypothetical protein